METFSALQAICAGNSPASGEFPAQRLVTGSFDIFFDLCLNKWLRKQSLGWCLKMPSHPLWHHCNGHSTHFPSGYLESTPIRLSIALESCVTSYNQATGQNLDLVFFKEATQHMARLTRVMVSIYCPNFVITQSVSFRASYAPTVAKFQEYVPYIWCLFLRNQARILTILG